MKNSLAFSCRRCFVISVVVVVTATSFFPHSIFQASLYFGFGSAFFFSEKILAGLGTMAKTYLSAEKNYNLFVHLLLLKLVFIHRFHIKPFNIKVVCKICYRIFHSFMEYNMILLQLVPVTKQCIGEQPRRP